MPARLLRRVLVSLAVVALVAAPLAPQSVRAADPFEINVIVSLTGPFAFIGSSESASVRQIEAIVNKTGGSRASRSR
jgi:hypothetical protein